MGNLTDGLTDIFLRAAFKKCPDLDNHEIIEAWFEGDEHDTIVIKSKRTDENGTIFYFTRLTVNVD